MLGLQLNSEGPARNAVRRRSHKCPDLSRAFIFVPACVGTTENGGDRGATGEGRAGMTLYH